MSRSVVFTLHLRPPFAHAKHSAGEQRLTDHALGHSAHLTITPAADAEFGPVNYHPGPGLHTARAGGKDISFPEDSWVEARYPLTSKQEHGDRAAWPWLPGWVVSVCGPDEWKICVQASELARQHEGETVYPVCFRDASELRSLDAEPEAGS